MSNTPTAASAHNMLKAVGLELAFVVVATMIAGISDTWASGMVTLMVALLVLRGLFEVDVFAAFANNLQLSSQGQFNDVAGGGDFGPTIPNSPSSIGNTIRKG